MYALTRSLIRSPALRQGIQKMQAPSAIRQITMRVVHPTGDKLESYDDKNIRLGREMSPHLTIYKPQLTSMLSITHRGTGMALSVYAWALGFGALMSSHDVSHYITMIDGLQLSSGVLLAAKFILAFPMAYHTCNGVRHLLWDTGVFLKIKEVYSTGYAMVGATFIMAVALAML